MAPRELTRWQAGFRRKSRDTQGDRQNGDLRHTSENVPLTPGERRGKTMKSKVTTSLIWVGGIYLALTTIIAAQVAQQEEYAPQTQVYIIERGDTLWDISSRFLESPWYWPQLWALNPYITNPHLIYPGDPLALAPTEPVQVAEAPPVAEPEPAMVLPPSVEAAPPPMEEVVEVAPPTMEEITPTEEMIAAPPPEVAEPLPPEPEEPEEEAVAFLPVPEEEPVFTEEKLEIPEEAIYHVRVSNRGFLSPVELERMGVIVSALDNKLMLSEGDLIFTNLGDGSGVKVGDKFSIVDQGKKVFHPQTKEFQGYLVNILGELEIIELNGDVSTAKILKSFDVISQGNYLRPFEQTVRKINLKHFEGQIDGWILEAQNPVGMIAENEMIYLDRGSQDGLSAGNIMLVYRPGGSVAEPGTNRKLNLPPRLLGKVLITDVKERTSSGLITSSLEVIKVGDRFRSGIF